MEHLVKVKVPATTANLGPGFDVLGAALKLHNEVEARFSTDGGRLLHIDIEGEGENQLPRDGRNVVWRAMQAVFRLLPKKEQKKFLQGSFEIRLKNRIPLSSGLGSSAAARLAGILAANKLAGGRLSKSEILRLGARLEGHPDNIVPACVGGVCVSALDNRSVAYIKLNAPALKAVVCTPDFELSTEKARKVLPKSCALSTAVFNCSRLAFFIAALQTRQYEFLKIGMEDRLHQPMRERLIPGMSRVIGRAYAAGACGAALSGAGPSMVALCAPGKAKAVSAAMQAAWKKQKTNSRAFVLDFDAQGASIG